MVLPCVSFQVFQVWALAAVCPRYILGTLNLDIDELSVAQIYLNSFSLILPDAMRAAAVDSRCGASWIVRCMLFLAYKQLCVLTWFPDLRLNLTLKSGYSLFSPKNGIPILLCFLHSRVSQLVCSRNDEMMCVILHLCADAPA